MRALLSMPQLDTSDSAEPRSLHATMNCSALSPLEYREPVAFTMF